jgi:hypothetical protein
MKRLLDEADSAHGALTELLKSAERFQSSPFSKRHVQSRLVRALQDGAGKRFVLRPALLGVGALLIGATAAAAGYSLLTPGKTVSNQPEVAVAPSVPAPRHVVPAPPAAQALPPEPAPPPEPSLEPPTAKHEAKLRAGEDPSQVAEAVRALRKQGDAARAQALLDQYLRANPHGALAEDALALSIEAAAARKDPRAADYARRYLARYPNGRFRSMAERALSR